MDIDMEDVKGKPPVKSSSRRKLTRQTPLSKESPSRVRRAHTLASSTLREDEHNEVEQHLNVDESDCVYVRKSTSTSRRKLDERKYVRERRKTMEQLSQSEIDSQRSVTATQCHCRTSLGNCRCRRIRQSTSDNVSESELMDHETKLIVLEFLRALTPEQLTARSKSFDTSSGPSRSASIDSLSGEASLSSHYYHQEDPDILLQQIEQMKAFKGEYSALNDETIIGVAEGNTNGRMTKEESLSQMLKTMSDSIENVDDVMSLPNDCKRSEEEIAAKRNSVKYNTVTIGEEEHKAFLEQLHKQLENQKVSLENTGGVKLGRSRSDVSGERYAAVRDKISAMKAPVEKWLDEHSNVGTHKILKDIKGFDKTSLNKTERVTSTPSKRKWSDRKNQGLSLKIPKNTIPPTEQVDLADTDIFTPETIAVHKLDLISQDIMANYPSLLDNPISLMLNFTKSSQGVDNYEGFTRVAKPVYEMKMNENNRTSNNNSNSTVLSRLAMVLYVVRETFVLGNLNDKQMELLVEHSTKFFREKAIESVKDEGGWEGDIFNLTPDGTETEEDECLTHGDNCPTRRHSTSDDAECVVGSRRNSRHLTSLRNRRRGSNVRDTLNEWAPYVGAVTAVGLGLLYTYAKH